MDGQGAVGDVGGPAEVDAAPLLQILPLNGPPAAQFRPVGAVLFLLMRSLVAGDGAFGLAIQ